MTYALYFHSLDYGPAPKLTYHGQSMPLIPRVGERVDSELFGKAGDQFIKDIKYIYTEDLIAVSIVVGSGR
jgi:hypothetical protein